MHSPSTAAAAAARTNEPIAIGSEAHKRLFCALMLDTHDSYDPDRIAWPALDEAARALFRQLSPLIDLMFAEPNPAPVKAALALAGLARAEVRQPLTPATRALTARLEATMALLPPAALPTFPPSPMHIPTATGKMPDCLKNVHHVT